MLSRDLPDLYVSAAPSPQNALDLFEGEWATQVPPPFSHLSAGKIPLFQDPRLAWGLQRLGGCEGQQVLELGPLEGGHSYMLEQSGAKLIIAIEANAHAFMKCLIAKEILGLQRVRFLIGNFIRYLGESSETFDLILASGVLYHMTEPLTLIELLAKRTNRLYLWTHYYDNEIIARSPHLCAKFPTSSRTDVGGFPCIMHRYEYQDSLQQKGFCGGMKEYSYWLERADILTVLARRGFNDVEVGHEQPDHPNGPSFGLVARRVTV
jgi:hypothetical protein